MKLWLLTAFPSPWRWWRRRKAWKDYEYWSWQQRISFADRDPESLIKRGKL